MTILGTLLNATGPLNRLALEATSMDTFLHKIPGHGNHLQLLYRPASPCMDLDLLRILLTGIPVDPAHRGTSRNAAIHKVPLQLADAVLKNWGQETSKFTPFPSPSQQEKSVCLSLVSHHCAAEAVAWMKHQRHLRLQQQGLSIPPGFTCCAASHHNLSEEVLQLTTTVNTMLPDNGKRLCLAQLPMCSSVLTYHSFCFPSTRGIEDLGQILKKMFFGGEFLHFVSRHFSTIFCLAQFRASLVKISFGLAMLPGQLEGTSFM